MDGPAVRNPWRGAVLGRFRMLPYAGVTRKRTLQRSHSSIRATADAAPNRVAFETAMTALSTCECGTQPGSELATAAREYSIVFPGFSNVSPVYAACVLGCI